MMLGTYESEKAVHTYIPANVPRPIAWGSYQTDENMYFYLAEFSEMVEEVPDPVPFVDIVARLHQESSGKSPHGKFGFHVPTHLANIPVKDKQEDTWEKCYTAVFAEMMEIEALAQGSDDEEFEELKRKMVALVIPRLLRPLETGGRKVIPCLIHTDLWPGNCMLDANTDEIVIFDSCVMWGHNEADLGSWRASRYRMGTSYIQEYQRRIEVAVPQNDRDDRNLLYAL